MESSLFSELVSELDYRSILDLCESETFREFCTDPAFAELLRSKEQEYEREKKDTSFPRSDVLAYIYAQERGLPSTEAEWLLDQTVHYATDAIDVSRELAEAVPSVLTSGMVHRAFEDTLTTDRYAVEDGPEFPLEGFFYAHGIEEVTEEAYDYFQMYLRGYIATQLNEMV